MKHSPNQQNANPLAAILRVCIGQYIPAAWEESHGATLVQTGLKVV
jgi:hypothetical protein